MKYLLLIILCVGQNLFGQSAAPILECKFAGAFVIISECTNIVVDDNFIYTDEGKFSYEEYQAGRDEYTYDVRVDGITVGRYIYDQNFAKISLDISVSDAKLSRKMGVSEVSVPFIAQNTLCDKILSEIKGNSLLVQNPEALNNKGYFLFKLGYHPAALILLNETVHRYPDRMVAYLNRGDILWAIGDKKNAKIDYIKYAEMMESSKRKRSLVPKYVTKRILD
ncbi:MAG TPA: hypothetical protein VF676_11080 [Flavobacterium sp.]|jgi:tetratricopeptide (TPR) repeat protein